MSVYVVFFFKQKTAYEMRISDWSSDVCSSDLNWINWQKSVTDQAPMLEKRQHVEGYGAVQVDLYSRKPDAASDAVFPPLGYASAALKSYRTFEKLLADGKIASGTRFMVALPTPFDPMMSF